MGWGARDIPDLSGKVAVVTGANSGLGLHTSLELARHGARVVMGCRDPQRSKPAEKQVREVGDAELVTLDLASLQSVRTFADEVGAKYDGIDIAVNNAGVMAIPRQTTEDGFEMQFGVNHLGHFALTGLLLQLLLARPQPRVVSVSSYAHRPGRLLFDDVMGEQKYGEWTAYAQSKLANLLFIRELARRAGDRLVAAAAHPGYASTNLQGHGPQMSGNRLMGIVMTAGNTVFGQSAADGALPQLYAATMPDVHSGDFFGPRILEWRGAPKRVGMAKAARDDDTARRLWELSEKLTGVSYDALG